MADLKVAVEKYGFTNIVTDIQSGNILFETGETNNKEIIERLEASFTNSFTYNSCIIVKHYEQLKKIVNEVPTGWNKRDDLRCNIAFIRDPVTAKYVLVDIELNDGVDFIKAGEGVLYMSTLLSGLTRSRFTKIIAKKVYKDISIRNYNTVRKLLELME